MSFFQGVTATKAGIELTRSLLDYLKREDVDRQEVAGRLLELQGLILEARQALSDAEDENRELKRQLEEREEAKVLEADMQFVQDGGFYVRTSERLKGILRALCPICWADSGKAIPMVPMANGFYTCAKHDVSFQTAEYKKELERARRQDHPRAINGPESWMG